MDNTLGIDCPKKYAFNNSQMSMGTPRRLSHDFDDGLVGDIVQPRKRLCLMDPEESFGPTLRSHSTPRRSTRIQKQSNENEPSSTVNSKKPPSKKPPSKKPLSKKPPAPPSKPGPSKKKTPTKARVVKPAPIVPKSNRTLELRQQYAKNKQKGSRPKQPSNAIVMKPHFQKPKMAHTVPKTPDFVRRLKVMRKRPNPHKSFAQKESEEVEKMKKYKFKAAPAPKASKTAAPSKKIKSARPTTKPVTPNLTKSRKRKIVDDEPSRNFKAQPVPRFSKPVVTIQTMKPEKKSFKFDKENMKPKIDFVLPGDAISKKKKEAFQKKLQEEAERQKARSTFRASSIRGPGRYRKRD